MRKYTKSTVLVCMMLCLAALLSFASFADVNLTDIEGHWAKDYITYGVEKGYINGYTDNTFKPDKTVTRAEFSKMINSAVKITGTTVASFDDVKTKDWFAEDVKHAQYAGYIKGYEDNTFRPNNPITRQEAAVILSRIVLPVSGRADLNQFNDKASIADWASDAIAMIAQKGYMMGDTNNNVTPNASLTRGQAAKLISEFVKNENIVTGVVEIKKGQTISQTLFTDGVTIICEEDAEIVLEDCRILGDIEVKSGMVVLTLGNTASGHIVNNSPDDLTLMVDKDSSVKTLSIYQPMLVIGDTVENVVVDGSNLQSGTVELEGDFANVEVNSGAILKITGGEVANLDVNKEVVLVIQAGEIKKLNVEEGAKGSVITLAQKVSVEEVENKAAVSYTGLGEIKTAKNNVTGVSFETQPKTVTGKESTSTDSKDEGKKDDAAQAGTVDSNFFEEFTITPANKKTGVSVSSNIVLNFDMAVTDKNGDKLDEDAVEGFIQIRKGSTSGSKVSYAVTVNSTKKITLNPSSNLVEGTKYYVIIPEGLFTYSNGVLNPKFTSYFTTSGEDDEEDEGGASEDSEVTFSPKNKATKVEVDEKIVITFSEKMYDDGGDAITSDYVEDEVELRKGSSNGTKVTFNATVLTTGKKITITPKKDLEEGTKYYVIIPSGTFENGDGDALAKQTIYFTTEGESDGDDDDDKSDDDELSIDITPEDGAKNISTMPEIIISFSEVVAKSNGKSLTDEYVEDDVIELRKTSKTGTKVDFTANVSSNKRKITVTPDTDLTVGAKYCLVIKGDTLLGEETDTENDEILSYFTVASATTPSVSPMNGSKGVPVDTKVVINFSDGLYTTASTSTRKEVDVDYIVDNDIITLRRKTTSGVIIDCDVEISAGGDTVTLTPVDNLSVDYKYYVVVKGSKLYGENKKAYTALTSYFETNQLMSAEFTPEDGDEEVKVDATLKIEFSEAVFNIDGGSVTKSYLVNNVVSLYKGDDDDGEEVEFTATISSDDTTITVTPDEDLEGNTDYTLVVAGGTLINDNEDENPAYKIVFTTESAINKTVEFTPEDKDTGVSVYANPTIEFKSKVLDKNGKEVTDKYATSAILLCLGTKTASKAVPAEVKVSDDGKKFTILPDTPLDVGKKYYIWIQANYFLYYDEETKVDTKSAYFTTASTMPELDYVETEDVTDNSLTLVFKAGCDGRVYFEIESEDGSYSANKSVSCTKNVEKTTIISGLTPGTKYIISAYVVASGLDSEVIEVVATTTGEAPDEEPEDPEEPEACEECGSTEHTTENHPEPEACEECGSTEHTTENHPAPAPTPAE